MEDTDADFEQSGTKQDGDVSDLLLSEEALTGKKNRNKH